MFESRALEELATGLTMGAVDVPNVSRQINPLHDLQMGRHRRPVPHVRTAHLDRTRMVHWYVGILGLEYSMSTDIQKSHIHWASTCSTSSSPFSHQSSTRHWSKTKGWKMAPTALCRRKRRSSDRLSGDFQNSSFGTQQPEQSRLHSHAASSPHSTCQCSGLYWSCTGSSFLY